MRSRWTMTPPSVRRVLAEVRAIVSGAGANFLSAPQSLILEVLAIGETVTKFRHGKTLRFVEGNVASERRIVARFFDN